MPRYVRFLIGHAVFGFGISALFVAAILAIDLAGLRTLMLGSGEGVLGLLLLFVFCGLTFGSIQMGIAIMTVGKNGASDQSDKKS